MASFGDVWNELTAQVRVLDSLAAQKFINAAWNDVGKAYEWSWLRALGVFSAPAAISTGTVSVSQFSYNLTFDAAATAVLDAIGLEIPLATRQIKIAGGPTYSLESYTAGGTATLNAQGPPFQEATASGASYEIVKAYYAPPASFVRFISARDPVSGYTLRFGPEWAQERLDRVDPLRSCSSSQPVVISALYTQSTIASSGETTAYTPMFELWPHPTIARGFQITYRKRTTDFVNDDDTLPASIDPDLLLWRAKALAYEWAEANKANQPVLQATSWGNLIGLARAEYKESLGFHVKHDRETFPNRRVFPRYDWGYPFSPDYLQSHQDPIAYVEAITGLRF